MKKDNEEWKKIALGNKEHFEIIGSGINNFKGKKDYLSTQCIQETEIKKIDRKISYLDRPSRANMQPIEKSVWFAKMQSTLKVYHFDELNEEESQKYILSTGFSGIKTKGDILPRYMRLIFISKFFNKEKDRLCTGSTQRGINNSFIKKIKIPIPFKNGKPDLDKQKQIVSILEKVEKLSKKREKSNKNSDEYLESIFNNLFFNKGFKEVKLGEISEKITDGVHAKPNYVPKGVPFISVINITSKYLKFDNCKYICLEDHKNYSRRCNPEKGDILYTKVGATYGIATMVDTEKEFSLYVSVCLIKPKRKLISPFFLKYLMNSRFIKKQADSRIKGIGVPDLHLIEIKNFKIPLPPIKLQE